MTREEAYAAEESYFDERRQIALTGAQDPGWARPAETRARASVEDQLGPHGIALIDVRCADRHCALRFDAVTPQEKRLIDSWMFTAAGGCQYGYSGASETYVLQCDEGGDPPFQQQAQVTE
jgi:hypothetical protein